MSPGESKKPPRVLEFTVDLPTDPDTVWRLLTDPAGLAEVGGVAVRPLDVLSKVIQRNIERNRDRIPVQQSHEIHFAIGHGRKDGITRTVRCDVVVTPDPLYDAYVDACTSMNASIAAQLILKYPRKPGVFAPESYFDAATYFPELEKRKFRISKTIV